MDRKVKYLTKVTQIKVKLGDECGVKPSLGAKVMTPLRECVQVAMLLDILCSISIMVVME